MRSSGFIRLELVTSLNGSFLPLLHKVWLLSSKFSGLGLPILSSTSSNLSTCLSSSLDSVEVSESAADEKGKAWWLPWRGGEPGEREE